MLRICVVLTLVFAALWGYAYADDDWDGGPPNVIHVAHPTADDAAAPADHSNAVAPATAAGAPVPASGNLGAYFGAGDVFLWSGAENDATSGNPPGGDMPNNPVAPAPLAAAHRSAPGFSAPPDAAHLPQPHRDLTGGDAAAGANGDPGNVYGPMWGVPEGTEGVAGFTPPAGAGPDGPAADGHEVGNGKSLKHKEAATSKEGTDNKTDIRNHKINRDDPNDW